MKAEQRTSAPPLHSRAPYLVVAVVFALVLLTFLPSTHFDFVNWDDDIHVLENPAVVETNTGIRERLLTPELGYPIPLTVAVYRAQYLLVGASPTLFHVTNAVLHLLNCCLVMLIAGRLGLGLLGAAVAVALFGLHPAVAEPVSWVSGLKDLLAGLFCLLSFYAHLRGKTKHRMWVTGLCFTAAVLAKPTALFLPLFLAAFEKIARGRRLKGALQATWPLFGIAAVLFVPALYGQQQVGAVRTPTNLVAHIREVWYALGYHICLLAGLVAPLAKHIPESMPPPFEPMVDLAPLLLPLSVGAARLFKDIRLRSVYTAGLLLSGLAYLPSAGIIPLSRYLADSYLYLPLVGVGLVLGSLVSVFEGAHVEPARTEGLRLARARQIGATIATAGLAAFLMRPTIAASSHWRNGISLWRSVYRIYPDSPRVCRNFGNAFYEADNLEAALALYLRCADRFGDALFRHNIAVTRSRLGPAQPAPSPSTVSETAAPHPSASSTGEASTD